MKNYIYAELDNESIEKLKSILPFRYNNVYGTHITLDWGVKSDLYEDLLGKSFDLTVDSIARDNYVEAIPVDITKSSLRTVNKHPHITWSITDDFDPYYSNYMLEVANSKETFEPIKISVTVKSGLF